MSVEIRRMQQQSDYCRLNQICVMDKLADAVMITDTKGIILYINDAFEQITGYGRKEVLGQTPRILKSNRQNERFYKHLWSTLLHGKPFREVFINRRKDGAIYYDEKTITPLKDTNGRVVNFIVIGKDITQRIRQDERLAKLAYYDSLTGLPNRMLFYERLLRAMRNSKRNEQLMAVAFLDLDSFKSVNDAYGHFAGDNLLKSVAHKLQECVRETDTVARLAGDEFVVLLEGINRMEDVERVLEKILAVFAYPLRMGTSVQVVRCSMGVSLFPFADIDPETLVRQADCAMYWAKQEGGRMFRYFESGMDAGT